MQYVTAAPIGRQVTVLTAFANASSLGSNLVLTNPSATAIIRVLSVVVVTTAANVVKFQSASNDISSGFPLGATGGVVMPFTEHGWFDTNAGENLNINLGTATATGVTIKYFIVV